MESAPSLRAMRKTLVVALVAAALIGGASTAGAINTYNSQPAPERTEVGAYVALWDNDGDGTPDRFDWVCSGAMIDADTFLTAAHCTTDWPEGTRHFVSLDQDFQALPRRGHRHSSAEGRSAPRRRVHRRGRSLRRRRLPGHRLGRPRHRRPRLR